MHEIGEEDDHVDLAPPPALGLGQRLPKLKRGETELLGDAVRIALAEPVVARHRASHHLGGLQQGGLAVGRLDLAERAPGGALLTVLVGHRTRRVRWSSFSKVLASRSWSARITCITALISARWVKACGKLPRWRPDLGSISSA